MHIEILAFAALRDLLGASQFSLEVPDAITIRALRAELERVYPVLEGRLRSVRFARNERFAEEDEHLAEGDVIALIPPVAGG